MKSVTYVIKCIPTCQMYVGSTGIGFNQRLQCHVGLLRRGTHYNVNLQNAWNEYGEDAFLFIAVEELEKTLRIPAEQSLLDFYWNSRLLFNISPTAGSPLGIKQSDETKAKKSAANKGQNKGGTLPESTRKKIGDAHRGRKRSEETRRRISESNTGKRHSIESRRKMSETKRKKSGLFTPEQIYEIGVRYIPGDSVHGLSAMAREFNVSTCAIWRILKGIK